MDDDLAMIGDDPLVDGMIISVRYRRDFMVTDAARLLEVTRRLFGELNPRIPPDRVAEFVTCAADAVYTLLEGDGLVGDAVDARLDGHEQDGVKALGWRAQLVLDEREPLQQGRDCLRTDDVFALPTDPGAPRP